VTPKLATFKYEHTDGNPWGLVNWLVLLAFAAVVVAGFALVTLLGIVLLILLGVVAVRLLPKKQIRLGVRYAIVGNTIVYFRNVRKMELNAGHALTLHWGDGRSLKIEQSRFPTNARKDDKIAKNKAAKFEKVSGKIIDRVLQASPAVALSGIDRQAHLGEKAGQAEKVGKAAS
jgi:hypothetical protein